MRIAIVGDVHVQWSRADSRALDRLGYDLVLFVGDLGDPLHRHTRRTARRIATLQTRALMIPGNHDGTTPLGVLAESLGLGRRRPGAATRAQRRLDVLQSDLGPVTLVGYTVHPLPGLTILAARPHAMDGRRLCFPQLLLARHGIASLEASAERLEALIDATRGPLLFLAHNGPRGLGSGADAPWSVGGQDIGDPDLQRAIATARRRERRVLAVIAGHVHHRGADRRWRVVSDEILYLNVARVPRIRHTPGGVRRHHVALTLAQGGSYAEELWLPVPGPRGPPRDPGILA